MRSFFRVAIALLALVLIVPSLASAKSLNAKKKGINGSQFQIGADLGLNMFGFIPYASATFNEEDASFSGSGGFGPIFGLHANLYPAKNWIIHLDGGYANQRGTATVNFDNAALKDQDFEYAVNLWRFSIGGGQKIIATSRIVPYWLLGLGLESVHFRDVDEDDPATGTGLGPFGALGVDVQITKTSGMYVYAGGQLRMDLIYTVTPLALDKTNSEITMGYVPIAMVLSGGVMF